MNRKVLIEVVRTPTDEYAVLVFRAADRDRTPLMRLRVHAASLGAPLWHNNEYTVHPQVDAELVAR